MKVKPGDLEKVFKLIKPFRAREGKVDKDVNTLIAEITITLEDKSQQKLFLRWYGKNPAIVSFDDKQYYIAEFPAAGDGVAELLKILRAKP